MSDDHEGVEDWKPRDGDEDGERERNQEKPEMNFLVRRWVCHISVVHGRMIERRKSPLMLL